MISKFQFVVGKVCRFGAGNQRPKGHGQQEPLSADALLRKVGFASVNLHRRVEMRFGELQWPCPTKAGHGAEVMKNLLAIA
jgi:hypothetical protein